jgi:hypothetical protein
MGKRKLGKHDQAVVDDLLRRLRADDAAEAAVKAAWGATYAAWVKDPARHSKPEPLQRPQGCVPGAWVAVTFPGQRRQPGAILPRLRTAREERAIRLANEGRRERHAITARATKAREGKARKAAERMTPALVKRIERMARLEGKGAVAIRARLDDEYEDADWDAPRPPSVAEIGKVLEAMRERTRNR